MGHRALVVYRQPDGTVRLHYCHWGQGLSNHISPATPFGGPADPSDAARFESLLGVEGFGGYDDRFDTRVDPRPLASDVSPDAVEAALDASFESLVVVSPVYDSRTFLVCSLDTMSEGSDSDVVLAHPDGDPDSLRSWFVEAKSRLAARVASGTLTRQAARATLRRALAFRATVSPPDDAPFLGDP